VYPRKVGEAGLRTSGVIGISVRHVWPGKATPMVRQNQKKLGRDVFSNCPLRLMASTSTKAVW
jgi:hypothetical protein